MTAADAATMNHHRARQSAASTVVQLNGRSRATVLRWLYAWVGEEGEHAAERR